MDIITIVLIVVSACILSLGISVVAKSRDNLNKFYFFNILTILGWSLAMIYYRLSNNNTILIWSRLLYVAASLIASNFLYFTYIFPVYVKVPNLKKILIFVPNLIIIALCLFGDLIITGAKVNPAGENYIFWGNLYFVYVIYILLYFNLAFYRLAVKRSRSKDKIERTQLTYVLLGYMASGVISFATNLILPSFGYFTVNWVGQVSTILMAISATYSIVKHRLFNTKVIGAELLTFAIWIIFLLQVLTSEGMAELIVSGLSLILSIAVGILLIRSVIKEVESR